MIGSDKVLDTNRYFVICSNVIGSCFGSTGPTCTLVLHSGFGVVAAYSANLVGEGELSRW